jgi:ribosomal protein L11 methyltransferase
MAFGFGTHATTQLAAQAVERHCLAHPGGTMLDVGTGTGVLALVALKSGAARAVGLDLDPVAVASAVENAALNGLTARTEFSNRPPHAVRGAFDLVAANITAPALIELADELARLTAPHGRLLVTGILPEGRREVTAAYDDHGLHVAHEERLEEWCLLELTHT